MDTDIRIQIGALFRKEPRSALFMTYGLHDGNWTPSSRANRKMTKKTINKA